MMLAYPTPLTRCVLPSPNGNGRAGANHLRPRLVSLPFHREARLGFDPQLMTRFHSLGVPYSGRSLGRRWIAIRINIYSNLVSIFQDARRTPAGGPYRQAGNLSMVFISLRVIPRLFESSFEGAYRTNQASATDESGC